MPHELEAESAFEDLALAIVGMAGRFPGAPNVDEFWRNLSGGIKSIRHLTPEQVVAAGADPAQVGRDTYVRAGGVLDDIDVFDAAFFGFTPREAEALDPQVRLFLQCAWAALEDAAYDPRSYTGRIGVFAGKLPSVYRMRNLQSQPDLLETVGPLQLAAGNDADALASLVAYKLDLRGPSLSLQTFCSTSLVAVHVACQSLLTQDCDVALAGGVAVDVPHGTGYLYEEGGILSPDGECRAFDASANGSVMGGGVGIVVLKRLSDALADGDQIYAIIRGSAVTNDGVLRASYGAPGLNGQAAVIAAALGNAGVDPRSIGYVVTHGTGTALGDAVELAAMQKVYPAGDGAYCAIGSIKPNIGHLDRASGVANLIAASLALKHQYLPPSLNFSASSPELRLDASALFVNVEGRPWPAPEGQPRRAGVTSFGLGGTNAHVVLQEAPPTPTTSSATHHLLVLSARTEAALERASQNLIEFLEGHPEQALADVAYTLQVGRSAFNHRRFLVASSVADAIPALRERAFVCQTFRDRQVRLLPAATGAFDEQTRARLEACGVTESQTSSADAVEVVCSTLGEAEFLALLGKLWLQGVSIDWNGLHTSERRQRISLPTYPFEEQRYWIDAAPPTPQIAQVEQGKRADVADWFYRPRWTESPRQSHAFAPSPTGLTVILEDSLGLGAAIADSLEARGTEVVRVGAESFEGFRTLLARLREPPARIVHLWSLDRRRRSFGAAQRRGYYSLQQLAGALGYLEQPLDLWTVTTDVQAVTGLESPRPEQAPIVGLARVLHQEQPTIAVRSIDVTLPLGDAWQIDRLAQSIAYEVLGPGDDLEIAYRGDRRWTLDYEPLRLETPAASSLRPGGVYLVTGGLGGIGTLLTQHLASRGAHVVVTTRQARHEDGPQILVRQADVANEAQMRAVLAEIDARFGRLDGVFHTAGISGPDFFAAVPDLTVAQTEAHFRPKVHGLYVLERVLAGRALDFCVVWSSVSSVLGGLTFGAYVAANRFIDSFVHAHNARSPQRWTAVNWDTWRTRPDLHDTFGATVAAFEMAPEEALEALERVLADGRWAQLVNSTGVLEARFDQWVRRIGETSASTSTSGQRHPRPELATPHVAPENETEQRIADIWASALGLERVGVHDNFLELGGHSLIAIQVVSRLRAAFQTHLPLSLLFQAPTVAELAVGIELAIIDELDQLAS